RHFHAVLVAELLGQLLTDHLVEMLVQARRLLRLRLARDLRRGSFRGGIRLRLRGALSLGIRSLVGARFLRRLWLLVFFVSHRSQLQSASRSAPSCRPPS